MIRAFEMAEAGRLSWLVLVVLGFLAHDAQANDCVLGGGKYDPDCQTVDIFTGAQKGQLEVRLIAKSAAECNLLVTNKSKEPLNVYIPPAVAGVPVLAQAPPFGNPNQPGNNLFGNPGGNNPGGNNQFAPQMVGIGVGGNGVANIMPNVPNAPWNNGPGQGLNNLFDPLKGGNNLFNLPPERVGKLELDSVCLEYGKPNPRARVPYELRPLDEVTEKPEIALLCEMLGDGRITPRVAQVATWHVACGQRDGLGRVATIEGRVHFRHDARRDVHVRRADRR